ncbi:MAG: HDIG domain-containing protein [Phycisphaerae bacterium]|nr:HDIG domain-containing protein [Phycisphaerae bacterium]
MGTWPTREEAHALLTQWTVNESLRKHAYAVEAAMRAYAARFGEDTDHWGIVGLLHDFDYEKHPSLEEHPFKGAEHLRSRGYDEELVTAILAHADHTGTPRDSLLKKTLCATDELTGLITAVALVRPSKKLGDVTVKSVRKKWKEKQFAAGVDRAMIERGAAELGVPLDEHIAFVLEAMKSVSDRLGL